MLRPDDDPGLLQPGDAIRDAQGAFQLGHYELAVQILSAALDEGGDQWLLYHNRGVTLARLGRYGDAMDDLDHAIRLAARPESYERRGLLHLAGGDRELAQKDWEAALAVRPDLPLALVGLGNLAYEDGHYRRAVEYFTQAIEAEPTLSMAFSSRARAYAALGKVEEGSLDLRKARLLSDSGLDTSQATMSG